MDNYISFILLTLCVVLVLLPPKYDPANRLKEWVLSRREKDDSDA